MKRYFYLLKKFLVITLVFSLLIQSSTVATSPLQAADIFSSSPEKRGIFQGLSEKFQGLFKYVGQKLGGASEGQPEPLSPITPTIPISGDLLQLDATWSAQCQKDIPPDELHTEVTEGRDMYCDWELPASAYTGNRYVSDPTACGTPGEAGSTWQLAGIGCQTDVNNFDPNPPPGGCIGGVSNIATCMIKVDEGVYHLHWRLYLDDDVLSTHQQGEVVGDALFGQGVISETALFGTFREMPGGVEDNWIQDDYYWPSPNRAFSGRVRGCGHFAYCEWQTGGAVDGSDGLCGCGCPNTNLENLRPYEFEVDDILFPGAQAAIAFQVKPSHAEADGCCHPSAPPGSSCTWSNGPYAGFLSEYTGLSIHDIAGAIEQLNCAIPNECMTALDCAGLGQDIGPMNCAGGLTCCTPDIPIDTSGICDPPPETCLGCDATDGIAPDSVADWATNVCYYPPDPNRACVTPPPPVDGTFDQCPLNGNCNFDPTDLCWGLFDPGSRQYDPSDVISCTGGLTPEARQAAAWPDNPGGFECRYQVPSANIRKYIGSGCNETENLPSDYRACSPIYTPDPIPDSVVMHQTAYIKKLNGCNAYFEGQPIPETGPALGISPPEEPPAHTGYCQNEGFIENINGEDIDTSLLCNTTDGMRCVNEESHPNICRKAIRVETFEKSHRTMTPPPGDAFTANCLKRETTGDQINCTTSNCSEPACQTEAWYCDDGTGPCCDCVGPAGLTTCNMPHGTPGWGHDTCVIGGQTVLCCSQCNPTGSNGCLTINENADLCNAPFEGDCTSNLGTPPCDTSCSDLNDCCKEENHCAFPQPPSGDSQEIDGPLNTGRNCSLYEWTLRENIYAVEYASNAIDLTLRVQNHSSHALGNAESDLENIQISVTLPDFLDYYSSGNTYDDFQILNPLFGVEPGATEYLEIEVMGDTIDHTSGENICAGQSDTDCNGHGGEIIWTLPSIPPAGEDGSDFDITLRVIPADRNSSRRSFYTNHNIPLIEVEHYTNNLFSDDRLINLEFNAAWAQSRTVELESFWVGQGVLSNARPTCSGDFCFVDPDSRPFGWPVNGIINQDWGGMNDGNPLAAIWGPEYGSGEGLYLAGCGDRDQSGEWRHTGIDIIPEEGTISTLEVFSTQAGYVTWTGSNPQYPDRGHYIEIQSSIDDDCHANFLTRYNNLLPGSIRVTQRDYVPRHKMLALMGYSGQGPGGTNNSGYTHLTYQIRYGQGDPAYPDIADNNNPYCVDSPPDTGDYPMDVDPLTIADFWYPEPDDILDPSTDACGNNPYVCESPDPIFLQSIYPDYFEGWNQLYGECDPTDPSKNNPLFFCAIRRITDSTRRCFYTNP